MGNKKAGTILFQLHCHTDASPDSSSSVENIIRECERLGIDAVAITDHNVVFDTKKLRKIKTEVLVIPGVEVNSNDDTDIIGLFVSRPVRRGRNIEIIMEIHRQNGVAVLPHPFRASQGFFRKEAERTPEESEEVLSEIDAVEVYNGKATPEENRMAWEFFQNKNIPLLGGSDAHTVREVGNVLTVLSGVRERSPEELKRAILEGRTEILVDPVFEKLTNFNFKLRGLLKSAALSAGIKKEAKPYQKARKTANLFLQGMKKIAGRR